MDTRLVIFEDETVICNLAELQNDDGSPLCLLMQYPFKLNHTYNEDEGNTVQFLPWCMYAQDTEFRIPFSMVKSVGVPKQFIAEKYQDMIKPFMPPETSEDSEVSESFETESEE